MIGNVIEYLLCASPRSVTHPSPTRINPLTQMKSPEGGSGRLRNSVKVTELIASRVRNFLHHMNTSCLPSGYSAGMDRRDGRPP